MDRIQINGLRAFGRHGVLPDEQTGGQTFVIDVELELDLSAAAATDALADTVDYGALVQRVADAVERTRFDLIEALAGHLADLAVEEPGVEAVTVRVAKPEAPLDIDVDEVAVVLRRRRGQRRR
jgi:dihydroneopterin aldolase